MLQETRPKGVYEKDAYRWADRNQLYIKQDELVDLLRSDHTKLFVVDARDEDRIGGHIPRSLHLADATYVLTKTDAALAEKHRQKQQSLVGFVFWISAILDYFRVYW